MKLLDNGSQNKGKENNHQQYNHAHHYSIGNGITDIKDLPKRIEDRSLSPNKRGTIIDEIESNLINISLEDLTRHFVLFEIFLEMEVVYIK